ncbi:hypothetical protein OAJ14_07165 [Polaribacter sp.]|nr:hypothetical protein [Polaribacter sp.]
MGNTTLFLDGNDTTWEKNLEQYNKETVIVNTNQILKLKIVPGGGVCLKLETIQ